MRGSGRKEDEVKQYTLYIKIQANVLVEEELYIIHAHVPSS